MKGPELDFVQKLEKELKPVFTDMYSNIEDIDNYWLFCPTWGKYYPSKENTGILFYGRATNGWKDYSDYCGDADKVFDFLFNRSDQVDWMLSYTGKPFVRLIKGITENFYPDEWNEHIAWSNVCKVEYGTPTDDLWDSQYSYITRMMEIEIDNLSPEVIVFVTGMTAGARWDEPLFEIDKFKGLQLSESIEWGTDSRTGKPLTSKAGKISNTTIIITDRPEFRPIAPHVEAIIDLIERLK
jgi:hypothetical protein